jgi:hypothetical protein
MDIELEALQAERRRVEADAERTRTIRKEKARIKAARLEKYKPFLDMGKKFLGSVKKLANRKPHKSLM